MESMGTQLMPTASGVAPRTGPGMHRHHRFQRGEARQDTLVGEDGDETSTLPREHSPISDTYLIHTDINSSLMYEDRTGEG